MEHEKVNEMNEKLVNTKESIKTKGQLYDLIRRNGLFTETEEEIREHQWKVAQLQKIWNNRKISEGGR